jgi:cytochrome c-type biogenesis protein CcmH/NrfG
VSSHAAAPRPAVSYRPFAVPRPGLDALLTVGIAGVIAAVAFAAQGGLLLGRTTKVELALLIGSGATVAVCALVAPARGRLSGATAAGLFLALGLFTVASIAWAVQPDDAWIESNRTLTYVAVFAAALALVRTVPDRWPALLNAVALAGLIVVAYALATRVLPGRLSADEIYARLRSPYGYWNAVGLTAAMAVPPFLWLGARREGAPILRALTFPAVGLLLVAVMLAYSRGALLALALGCAFWFWLVPLRLRGAAVLGCAAIGAALVVVWTFSQDALTQDRVPLDVRADAGHQLGLLLIAMVLALTAAGLAVCFAGAAHPLRGEERRRAGIAVLCALALIPAGVAIGMTQSERGLFGTIGHDVSQLVDPSVAGVTNSPSRLTKAGSVRARYWKEALQMFGDHPALGVGAGGYATARPRYRHDSLEVRHAHGYVVQTLADLGLVGLLLSLLALGAWAVAAVRSTSGLRRSTPYTPERIGLLTMLSIVVIFGVHSFVDWTWFVPANALVAILCAGWLAGRGAPEEAVAARPRLSFEPRRVALAVASVGLALVAAWAVWQPLRSLDSSNDGLAALERNDLAGARAHALSAHARDPLALDPLTVLAIAESRMGNQRAALIALQKEIRLQPANHEVWLRLADFELNRVKRPKEALRALAAALYLDPRDPVTVGAYLEVSRRVTGKTPNVAPGGASVQPGETTTPTPGQPAPTQPKSAG